MWIRFAVFAALLGSINLQARDYTLPGFSVFAQPDEISCGPTSASMLLNYYGINAGIGPLKTKAGTTWWDSGGMKVGLTHPANLRDAIVKSGLNVNWYGQGNVATLVNFINAGRPVIVLVRAGRATWHYAVVVGFQNDGQKLLLADPAGGQLWWIQRGNFEGALELLPRYAGQCYRSREMSRLQW